MRSIVHRRCSWILALLLLLTAATVSASQWEFHAWNFVSNQRVNQSYQHALPTDEDEAVKLICSSLTQASESVQVGITALSSDSFHPGLNRVCRMANLACVYTGAGPEEFSTLWKTAGSVEFYPHRSLYGMAVSQFVRWSEWTLFSVLYTSDKDLDKYKETLVASTSKILFRKIDVENRSETFVILSSLKQSNVFQFVLDIPPHQLPELLQLTAATGIMSVSHNYLYIGWISPQLYNESVSNFLFAGCNFTTMQLGGWQAGASYSQELSVDKRLSNKAGSVLNSAYRTVRDSSSDWGSRVEPLAIDVNSTMGALCNISRKSTGKFLEAVRNKIKDEIGVLNLAEMPPIFNFSFDIFHFYTSKVLKFATWTADRGFRQVAGAYQKHLEQFDQYVKKVNFTVVSVEDPPFSIYREFDADGRRLRGNDRWTGFAVELFKKIAHRMSLRFVICKSSDGKFGSPVEGTQNREWSGMVGELIKGTAHFAVASLTITYDREKVVDFTTPYMSLGLSVIMKKSAQDPDLFQFLLPFSNRVWLYMVLAWLLTAVIMYFCARLSPYEWYAPSACDPVVQNQFSPLNSLWFTIGSLMQQGSDLAPRATSTRLVGSVWWFFTLILISSYTANLAAFLTVTRLNDISSIGDLAGQSSIKYGTLLGGSTYNFFRNAEIPVYKTMWEAMSSWAKTNDSFMPKTADGIERVRRGGYAYILESTFNTYYRERDCSLMQVGGIFNPMSYAFGVSQGNVIMRDRLTEEILKLQKEQFIEGLTETWLKRYNVSQPCSDQARSSPETGTLDVDAVGGVFVSLLIGLSIAGVVCLLELIIASIIGSGKQKASFQQVALRQVRLAVSCSDTADPPAELLPTHSEAAPCIRPTAEQSQNNKSMEQVDKL